MTTLDRVRHLREAYHRVLQERVIVLRAADDDVPLVSTADRNSRSSRRIAASWFERLPASGVLVDTTPQGAGSALEGATRTFLEGSFDLLREYRPGDWEFRVGSTVSLYDQYWHLELVEAAFHDNSELRATFGSDYLIRPDIVISRLPITGDRLGRAESNDRIARYSPLLASAELGGRPTLHASISCKLTIRSDRAQNTRTEALNLIRNRKGRLPHVVAVTAEPMPTRIASLALGTGDLDCVYHVALPELVDAVNEVGSDDAMEMLTTLVSGRRLRDISDLPLDLAI